MHYLDMVEAITAESAAVVTLLLTIAVGVYRTWNETGAVGFTDLPWKLIRKTILTIRRMYFTHPKPEDTLELQLSVSRFQEVLIEDHFEDGWYVSYHYEGEDINLRRPQGKNSAGNRQRHIRVWDNGDGGVEFEAHDEMSPIQNPKEHLLGKNKRDTTELVAEEYGLSPAI